MSKASPRFRRTNQKLPTPSNNVYRVKLVGLIEGQLTINTFYYVDQNALGTANQTHLQNLQVAVAASGSLAPKYAAAISADWGMSSIIIDCPTSPTLAALTTSSILNGGGPAGHEPTEVAAVIIRYTNTKGQCGRGRVELPGVPSTWISSSRIATQAAYVALATEMLAVLAQGGDTFTPALYSRNGSRAFPGSGVAVLTNTVSSTLLGTIRRRKIGRGK